MRSTQSRRGGETLAGDVVEAGEERDVLFHREVAVEGEQLRHVADALLDLLGVGADVEPGHASVAGARREQAGEHLDGGRLAGAVGAEEAEDLALGDLEAHMVDGDEIAERAGEIADLDGVGHAASTGAAVSDTSWMNTSSSEGSRSAISWTAMPAAARARLDPGPVARALGDGQVNDVAEQRRRGARRACAGAPRPRGAGRRRCSDTMRPASRRCSATGRVEGDDSPAVEERDPVAALRLVHVGRGDEHGDALGDHLVDDEPQVAPRDGVDAERRLVEEQDLRLVDEGAAEAELLLHAAGELAGEALLRTAPRLEN